jgi:CRISPR system Cascade subunit CasD
VNTLFIRLEGPLQSWGTRSRWGERDTALEPTKSGVIGLLACCLGWGWSNEADVRQLSQTLRFGVRVDRPGRILTDFHTVVGGVRSAEGKIKITASTRTPETVSSHRAYLSDASFLAALRGDAELIDRLELALQDPVWPPFLGRRSCPPAVPLWAGTGEFDSLQDALLSQPALPRGQTSTRIAVECAPGEGAPRNDEIVSLRRRSYATRYSRDESVALVANQERLT